MQTKEEADAAIQLSWKKMSKARKEPYIVAAQERNEKNINAYQNSLKEAEKNQVTDVSILQYISNSQPLTV